MAHTPGPWKRSVKTWDGTEIRTIVGPDGEEIAQEPTEFYAYASGAFVEPAGMEANLDLDLAAAAPELLAACESLLEFLDDEGIEGPRWDVLAARIRAVIAKAKPATPATPAERGRER